MPATPELPGADLAYSSTLAGAMLFVAAAWLLWALARGGPLLRWSRLAAALATVLILLSGSVHLFFGHPPSSERALGPIEFVVEHPAMFLVAAAAFLGRWLTTGERAGDG